MRWGSGEPDEEGCRYVVAEAPPRRTVGMGAAALMAAASAALAALATALVLAPGGGPPPAGSVLSMAGAPEAATTALSADSVALAERTENLFSELTPEEARAVARFAATELGCDTAMRGPGAEALRGCFLSGSEAVSLLLPTKAAALAHLDEGAPAPARMAQAIMVHGNKPPEEGLCIYSVGPLDGRGGLAPGAKLELLRALHINRRPVDLGDVSGDVVTAKVVRRMKELLLDSFGPVFPYLPEAFDPREAGQVFVLYSPAVSSTLQHRVSRAVFNWFKDPAFFEINWMHPLPFLFDIVYDGKPEDWYAVNITYCGQAFPTLEAFAAAEQRGEVRRCDGQAATAYGWDAAGPSPGSLAAAYEPPKAPAVKKTWQVHGRGALRWGEWEFYATVRPGSGLALHDVRWRGERILYELSLSDAHAYYSSPRSDRQFHYSDKAFSLAQLSGDLVPGLDCPEGASFLDGTVWMLPQGVGTLSDVAAARPLKLLCVFESNGYGGSVWRHAQLVSRQVNGRPNRKLVVRSVSTVGNYDYISEVQIGEDGGINVRNEFAGYPEAEVTAPFHQPAAGGRRIGGGLARAAKTSPVEWGSRVRADLVAYLHSHFCVWKVDLDILGRRNEFHVVKSKVQQLPGEMAKKVQEARRVDAEDPADIFASSAASPGLWRIVNPEAPNPVSGVPRGYAVVIQTAPALQTLPAGHPFTVAGSFAKRHLAVTQHKDSEPSAVHSLDHYPLTSPLLSVDDFLSDRQSLVGEDLVCWVSIGKEHITRAEDIPLVSNFGVQFSLMPWSYSDENPAMQLPMLGGMPRLWEAR